MKKILLFITLAVSLVFSLAACNLFRPYDPEDFIGLTSAEIVEKYGEFDHVHTSPGKDGLYRNTMCGYIVKEAEGGFLGTDPPEYFLIYFDENGIGYKCTYEPGGWGG